MATYKVLQDIEAEDKILGPLTLKQFVFAGITIAMGGLGYFIASNTHFAAFIPFLIPMIPFGFLAAPIGRDQPNDVWLAARLRFIFKPKVRTWDQTGMQEFVTITVPKREAHIYTDGLNRDQVVSRLKALANTVDSRGWAVKNVNLNLSDYNAIESDDRLIKPSEVPQQVQEIDVHASDDILDNNASSVSQHFQKLIDDKTQAARLEAIAKMDEATKQAQAEEAKKVSGEEQAFLEELHRKQERLGIIDHGSETPVSQPQPQPINSSQPEAEEPVIASAPLGSSQPEPATQKPANSTLDPAIIKQYSEIDEFSVATIQEQVNKPKVQKLDDGFEVSLH